MAAPSTLPPSALSQVDAPAPLRLWHLTSLDAPTVAVVWCLAFAWAANVAMPLWLLVVLALAAWSFYIADRLLDVRRGLAASRMSRFSAPSGLRPRHHFHWTHRRFFVPAAIAATLTALGLVLHWMPVRALARNFALAASALAYFASVHGPQRLGWRRLRPQKELLVGVLFTLACATPAWARMASHRARVAAPMGISILVFIALAWLNCVAIETWESGGRPRISIVRGAGALGACAILAGVLAAALRQPRPPLLMASAVVSAALLGMLDRYRKSLGPTTLRAAADLALLTPLALLLLP